MVVRQTGERPAYAWFGEVLAHIRDEYDRMPGLCLTPSQAQRLWALDARTCRVALTRMVDTGFLVASPFGYVRGDAARLDGVDDLEFAEGWENGAPCQSQARHGS
jgi:hypothetical protein